MKELRPIARHATAVRATTRYAAGARHCPRGTSLVELLVVLAIVAVAASVATIAARAVGRRASAESPLDSIARARAAAVRTGRAVEVDVRVNARLFSALALPDGSVVADSTLAVEHLSGRPARAER